MKQFHCFRGSQEIPQHKSLCSNLNFTILIKNTGLELSLKILFKDSKETKPTKKDSFSLSQILVSI